MEAKVKELEQSLEKVAKKQKSTAAKTDSVIDSLLTEVNKCSALLSSDNMDTEEVSLSSILPLLSKKAKEIDPVSKVSKEHKEYHVALSRFGKLLDKSFTTDISKFPREVEFEDEVINQIIAQHFYREGQFEIGDRFVQETNINVDQSLKEPFQEMHRIVESLSQKNLQLAIQWAQSKRRELEKKGNTIEFKLHRLQYLELLSQKRRNEAIRYAQKNFSHFSSSHMKEIRKLMGCLLFSNRLETSPYASLFNDTLWPDIKYDFTCACCSLLGLSYESSLLKSVTAGAIALPKRLKMASLMQGKGLKSQPVEIQLGPEFQFHSIFACPVSREQSSADNPPMLLNCGHVICLSSMQRLAKGGSRFKCPYCPMEALISKAVRVTF